MKSTEGYREVLALSLPIAGVQLIGVILTTTDILMLRSISVVAIAGGGLAMQFYNQIRTMCVGMVTPSANLIAEAASVQGVDNRPNADASAPATTESQTSYTDRLDRVRQQVRSSVAVGLLTGFGGTLLVIALGLLALILPIDPDAAWFALCMTLTLGPSLIPMIMLNVLRQFAVGLKRPGSLLVVTAVSAVLNVFLDWAAVSLLDSPILACSGIGLATTLVQMVNLGFYFQMLRNDPRLSPYLALRPRRDDVACIRNLIRMGTPVSLTYGSEAAITTAAALVMGTVSAPILAAHNVVNQMAYVVYQVCIGFSHGGSVLVSSILHRGAAAVRAVANKVLVATGCYLTAVGLVWIFAGQYVVCLIFGRPADEAAQQMVDAAAVLLIFAVVQQYTKGFQNVLVGLLRGLRDTTSGLKATLIGYWLIGVPTIILLGHTLSFGGYGVWSGLILGFGTTALLLARTFARKLRSADDFDCG